MRHFMAGVGLGTLLLATGCNNWPHTRGDNVPPAGRLAGEAPSTARLVEYLNDNARRVQGLECLDLDMDCKQGFQAVGLSGKLALQKPRNFRLVAKVVGNPEVDIGSNDQEFWYWIRRAEPKAYVFHCTHEEFSRGGARYMPFPFQPDWIMEALGVAEYDPAKKYELVAKASTYELVEQSTSPKGERVREVTVFSRSTSPSARPQVTAHLLQDANGKEICSAYITEVKVDPGSGAVLPRRVNLIWAQDKTELKLKLDDVRVGPIAPQRSAELFTRNALSAIPAFDLARGPDVPGSPVQRVRGQMGR